MAEKEKVVIKKEDVQTVKAEDLLPTPPVSKTPLLDEFEAKLKAEETRLESIVAPAKKELGELLNSERVTALRKVIKENEPELGKIKNELARIMRTKPGVTVMKTESGSYNHTAGEGIK